VLRTLRRFGPATRAELAKLTGLAKATVGVIVADLEAVGAVAEEGARPGVRGRPGRPVALRGERFVALGLELNVDYVSAVVLDLAGHVRFSETRPAGASADLASLAVAAQRGQVGPDRSLVGATVAVPGLVRGDNRTVAWAPNLEVEGRGLADDLAVVLPGALPGDTVRVSNDANCAAYAESHHGAAKGARHALYLTGTVGIGAGIVQDGELVRGGPRREAEVGDGRRRGGHPERVRGARRAGQLRTK
jgi:predicted NBD/HSP70 family sugar kinase